VARSDGSKFPEVKWMEDERPKCKCQSCKGVPIIGEVHLEYMNLA